jgi:cytochrome c peroxidase
MRKAERNSIRGACPQALAFLIFALASSLAGAQAPPPLPPVPVPAANPITEEKRVLGKILFWDEQLSGDNTVACGTCHTSERSGTEGRVAGINPGPDAVFGTPDDIRASFGVAHADVLGTPVVDPIFGLNRQVTRRAANAAVMAAYSPELFWDGRARTDFFDPETGALSIANGGALENQATGPILSSVEMGRDQRSWSEVSAKLRLSEPLGHATSVPPDVLPVIASHPTYPELFQAAFGDSGITGERIALAIATYERTLVANQTPWDRFVAGVPGALTPAQQNGWNFFRGSPCAACHTPPLFTNNTYTNIGVRPPTEDSGRREVTGLVADRGKFKVPTLRGVGLKTSYMHNGVFNTIPQVIAHYRPNNPAIFLDNIDPRLPVPLPPPPPGQPNTLPADLADFLANGLTDPRVAGRTFPFDQPQLQAGSLPQLSFGADKSTISWPSLQGVLSYVVYRGDLSDLVDTNGDGLPDAGYGSCVGESDPNPADTIFVDNESPAEGRGFFYLKGVIDGATVRGLGVTSAVKPRVPAVLCS